MLDTIKLKALKIFLHSRISGKYSTDTGKKEHTKEQTIVNTDEFDKIVKVLFEFKEELEIKRYTMDDFNKQKHSQLTDMVIFYYTVLTETLLKFIGEDDLISETFLSLCILTYLSEEKSVLKFDQDGYELIEIFKAQNFDKELLYKLFKLSGILVDELSEAKYSSINTGVVTKSNKRNRNRANRKKRTR